MLNHSEACERNKEPILAVLQQYFLEGVVKTVLEVGSGTGQHAVFFGQKLPFLTWQTADQMHYLADIKQRLAQHLLPNVVAPIELQVQQVLWPVSTVEAVFSANTLHIMDESHVQHFFRGCAQVIAPDGCLAVYGPFKYANEFTSQSNADFDASLRSRNPAMGIRDIEWVQHFASAQGFVLQDDVSMPANNQLLIWRKSACN